MRLRQGEYSSLKFSADIAAYSFFANGKELKSYRLADLVSTLQGLGRGQRERVSTELLWLDNFRYDDDKKQLTITTVTQDEHVFDITTGRILKSTWGFSCGPEAVKAEGFLPGSCQQVLKAPLQHDKLTIPKKSLVVTAPGKKLPDILYAELGKGGRYGKIELPEKTILAKPFLDKTFFVFPKEVRVGALRINGLVHVSNQPSGASVVGPFKVCLKEEPYCLHPDFVRGGRKDVQSEITVFGAKAKTAVFDPSGWLIKVNEVQPALVNGFYVGGEIKFWPNGRLESSYSTQDQVVNGVPLQAGAQVWGDEDGSYGFIPVEPLLFEGKYYIEKARLLFWLDGKLRRFTSGKDQIIQGKRVEKDTTVCLDRKGQIEVCGFSQSKSWHGLR